MLLTGFSTDDTARISGVNAKTLHYWHKTGLLSASVAGARGRGSSAVYSLGDVVLLSVVHRLRTQGDVSLQAIRVAMPILRKIIDLTGDTYLVLRGNASSENDVDWFSGADSLAFCIGDGCVLRVIRVGKMVKEIREHIENAS